MSTPGTGNINESTQHSGLPLPENSASPTSTSLHPQGEVQATAIEPLSGAAQPTEAEGIGGVGSSISGTRTRRPGRPRKYAPQNAMKVNDTSTGAFPAPPDYVSAPLPPSSSNRKRRGRPPGPGIKKATRTPKAPIRAKQNNDIGITVRHLTAHAIFVSPGEDLAAKIITFAQQGTANIFISSVYGALSSATLRRPTLSNGFTTYEGHYDVINLSGSLIQSEADGKRVWTGGLTITLCGPDNYTIVVGGVAGSLIAATPLQVIVGTFVLPREEELGPGTVDPVNITETCSPAAGGAENKSGDGGGGNGGGDGVGTSIPDDIGLWNDVNTPGTSNM